uniref:Secreted protein n=1 Tax=Achlya hypogyna TaxID=1202772 RepID=A0A0A7CPG4_ACHHY|nr:secreted protein [Achlya hypogyna]
MRAAYLFLSYFFPWVDQLLLVPTLLSSEDVTTPTRSLEQKKAMAVAFVQGQLESNAVPGFGLSVVYKNETLLAMGFGTKQYGNASNVVTSDTQFQIGSFSKTFIAMGIAKLVDEGRMTWDDPVKTHLPWFALQDKYAEQATTIGDLLSMNSVFGAYEGDSVLFLDQLSSEREVVRRLANYTTSRSLRPGYAYANINFAILGQIIEYQTNSTWAAYLDRTFFQPLGMTKTYSRAHDIPNDNDISFGHKTCGDVVAGPFDLRSSPEIALRAHNNYIAAGSIISTPADLSKFSHFILSKGEGIFKSPHTVATMITGHSINTGFAPVAGLMGYSYDPDGGVLAAGYGFDIIGDVMYGHQYFDKGGDTIAFKTRNGFIPAEELGVILLSNAEAAGGRAQDAFLQDRMRSYLLGIFLDVPEATLKKAFDTAAATADSIAPPHYCSPIYFGGKSWADLGLPITKELQTTLAGTYAAEVSTDYYGNITLRAEKNDLVMQFGVYAARLLAAPDAIGVYMWTTPATMSNYNITASDVGSARQCIEFMDVKYVKIS